MTSDIPRHVLPIPDRASTATTMYDASSPDVHYAPIEPLRPPKGAPNIFLVLLDDAGFGSNSAFGGPCRTATFDWLASNGLRYTRFHTTAICSSTRQALLTGRNHHSVGMGTVSDMATAAPGYTSVRPNTAATIAEMLRLNGYSTAQIGKCHEAPTWEWSPMGPFDRWPTGSGFEYFYGFIGGEASQFYPSLTEGTAPIIPDKTPEQGYHLTEDLATRACRWLSQQYCSHCFRLRSRRMFHLPQPPRRCQPPLLQREFRLRLPFGSSSPVPSSKCAELHHGMARPSMDTPPRMAKLSI